MVTLPSDVTSVKEHLQKKAARKGVKRIPPLGAMIYFFGLACHGLIHFDQWLQNELSDILGHTVDLNTPGTQPPRQIQLPIGLSSLSPTMSMRRLYERNGSLNFAHQS